MGVIEPTNLSVKSLRGCTYTTAVDRSVQGGRGFCWPMQEIYFN
jgi:hypothetical protein